MYPRREDAKAAVVATSKNLDSGTGTRTLGSCVKGKYVNHLHHTGTLTLLGAISNKILYSESNQLKLGTTNDKPISNQRTK